MPIETADDIIEELADKLGIYGAHDEDEDPDYGGDCSCRCCWTAAMRERLETAFNLDAIMQRVVIRASIPKEKPVDQV